MKANKQAAEIIYDKWDFERGLVLKNWRGQNIKRKEKWKTAETKANLSWCINNIYSMSPIIMMINELLWEDHALIRSICINHNFL